jgi:TldD protein
LNRRDFLQGSAAAAALSAIGARSAAAAGSPGALIVPPNGAFIGMPNTADNRELAQRAVDAAKQAGASYADCRVARNQTQNVSTRDRRVQGVVDNETQGFGVRVLVDGSWGFAASRDLTTDEVVRVAKQAVAQAKANRPSLVRPVVLAPKDPTPGGTWKSPIKVDPFDVAIEDKVALLMAANEAALKVKGSRFVNSSMFFLREEKTFASSDGTVTVQTIYRAQPSMTVTAVSADFKDFQTRESTDIAPRGLGYEHVTDAKLVENAPRWAQEAVEKLSAKSVDVGRYDVILHPSNLWLTIHETIAHPTELDRAMGYEANYAGTSFVAPPEKVLGTLRYGSDLLNIQGNRSEHGSLSACGWDDEGVKPDTFDIIKNGMVVDYHATTRDQAPYLDWWYKKQGKPVRSHGCSYAQSWGDVQFSRMPNVSQQPGAKDTSWNDIIAATDRGIAIVGDSSFSIDQQRYNGQFGGQLFYEVKGGKIVGMLKDVVYQFRTPEFWKSMDMIGGKSSYFLGGAFGDAKGQPVQVNAVTHGCVPSRFKNVNIINTARSA